MSILIQRIFKQDLRRITKAIQNKFKFSNNDINKFILLFK